MPPFPGLGYPLVPGYESVGRIREAGTRSEARVGDRVFVPGARCYGDIKGLFGGASSRVVVPGTKAIRFEESLGEQGVLLALAATAYHALDVGRSALPQLVIGHGVLGRLIARLVVAVGRRSSRRVGNQRSPRRRRARLHRYRSRHRYPSRLLLNLRRQRRLETSRHPHRQTVTRRRNRTRRFYSEPLSFAFPPAFMREARLRVAAEWKEHDLIAVRDLIERGALSLDGLITHREPATAAGNAYRTAFTDPDCLKMILDWRQCS